MTQRNPTRPFLIAPLCLAALLLGLTCTTTTWAQEPDCNSNAKLTVGSATAPSGLVEIELRGGSECPVTGFGLAIGHDGTQVEFVSSEPGLFFKTHAGDDLVVLEDSNDEFMRVVVVWQLFSETNVPPTRIPDSTLLATLTYRILPGVPLDTVVELRNETNTFGVPGLPVTANVFTSDGPQIEPAPGQRQNVRGYTAPDSLSGAP